MNMVVCVKQVPDPEIPRAKFRIDPVAKQAIPPEGLAPIINPYDERAVELALRVKEKHGGKITVLTVGETGSETVVKHALSMGADEGIVLSDQAFEGSDSFGTAYILTRAIQKVGSYDLILCGRQAADWDEGLVGSIIAENLSLPLVTLAVAIDVTENGVEGETGYPRRLSGVCCAQPRCRHGQPGGGSTPIAHRPRDHRSGTKAASRMESPRISMQILLRWERRQYDETWSSLFIPERDRSCKTIQGETPGEAGAILAERLREVGAI